MSRVVSLALLLITLVVLEAALLHLGPTVQMLYGHDILVHLSGAYRVLEGQVPHRDFTTDAAALTFFLLALASPHGAVSVQAFVNLAVFFTACLSLWCWALAQVRLDSRLALFAAVTVACLMAGTYNQGDKTWVVTYAMSYNRLGYGLLYLVALEVLLRRPGASPRAELVGGVSTGFLIASLIFLKVTYLVVAIFYVLLRAVTAGLPRRWWLGAALGAALLLVPLLAYMQVDLVTIMSDQTRMLGRRPVSGGYVRGSRLTSVLENTWYMLPCLFLLWYRLPRFQEGRVTKPVLGLWLAGATGTAFCLMLTNYSESAARDLPLAPFLALLPMEYQVRYGRAGRERLVMLLLLAAVSFPTLYRNVESLVVAHRLKADYGPHVGRFESEPLRDLLVANASGYGNGEPGDVQFYARKINDGIQLLRQHAQPTDRIESLTFENPFPMALGLRSPKGVQLCWHCGGNFDFQLYPPAEQTLADSTLLMVPTAKDPLAADALLKLYGPYLQKHFVVKAQTPFWVLLARNPAENPGLIVTPR